MTGARWCNWAGGGGRGGLTTTVGIAGGATPETAGAAAAGRPTGGPRGRHRLPCMTWVALQIAKETLER